MEEREKNEEEREGDRAERNIHIDKLKIEHIIDKERPLILFMIECCFLWKTNKNIQNRTCMCTSATQTHALECDRFV